MAPNSLFNYQRRQTSTTQVGDLQIGSSFPIRVQSMANTDTNSAGLSVKQAIRIVEVGGELVRFTTQGLREADSLAEIHKQIRSENCSVPLVADVHFNPKVAEHVAQFVEKVRINPGNFVASKHGEYTDEEWNEELKMIEEKLVRLLNICKQHKTALRIGVNHGSLSPRILNRYGDTPQGLVVSCMEFLKICKKENFNDVVLSVKSSNTLVMVQAVRLLVKTMNDAGMHFPLHLGVTEAGEGEDGRIKSAVGIGTLLAGGIGDTIRVSLSEDPENEIPVAQKLVNYISSRQNHQPIFGEIYPNFDQFSYHRRPSFAVGKIGGNNPVAVVGTKKSTDQNLLPDIYLSEIEAIKVDYKELTDEKIAEIKTCKLPIILHSNHQNFVGEMRAAFHRFMFEKVENPVIIAVEYVENELENLQIKTAADLGALLLDGFGDAVLLTNNGSISQEMLYSTAFGVLQAARVRMVRTEYISCPSCGRTLFDLQKTVAKVKEATSHYKNLKIAIMGCIVNGPGEMADADYGYVGAGKGKVSLYRKNICIQKNIPEEEAIVKLMSLIEKDNKK